MFSDGDDNQGIVLGVLFGVIALVIGLVIGLGIYKTRMPRLAAPVALVLPGADLPSRGFMVGPGETVAPRPAAPVAGVAIELAGIRIYFDPGQSALPASAVEPLAGLAQQAIAGHSLIVSGYLDTGRDAARNEQLARQRVLNVRDALIGLGVAPQKMLLAIPAAAASGGPEADARRVDVRVQ